MKGPVITRVEPVLAVRDLQEGVAYFVDRLGFENAWTWGEPPERAGVVRGAASLQLVASERFAPTDPSVFAISGWSIRVVTASGSVKRCRRPARRSRGKAGKRRA